MNISVKIGTKLSVVPFNLLSPPNAPQPQFPVQTACKLLCFLLAGLANPQYAYKYLNRTNILP